MCHTENARLTHLQGFRLLPSALIVEEHYLL